MKNVPLGKVCHIIMGQAPPGKSYNENSEGWPLISGAGNLGQFFPITRKFTTSLTKESKKGDIILCIRATIGDVNWSDQKYCLGRGVAGLRPNAKDLNSNYLWHYLRENKSYLASQGKGSTFKQISRHNIESLQIPLPDNLKEQIRIAAILDKADAIRRKRQQGIKLADEFLRSVFLDMFGDPVTNPKRWETAYIGNIAQIIVPSRDKPKSFSGDVPWITLPDVKGLFIGNAKNLLTCNEANQVNNRIMPRYTVLLSCAGSLGVIAVTNRDVYTNQQFYGLVSNKEMINPIYLAFNLRLRPKEFYKKLSGTVTISFFSKAKASEINVSIPHFELQEKFAKVVTCVYTFKEKLLQASIEEDALFNSLTQRAFRGEL